MGKKERKLKHKINDLDKLSSPKNKKIQLSQFSLQQIFPKTANQELALNHFTDNKNLLLCGSAGTGKTYLALYLALQSLFNGDINKIVIMRSVVPSRDAGFLPGTLQEKLAVYETPYKDICTELLGRSDAYDLLKKKGHLEFLCTSYVRGTTIKEAAIIIDEYQNMTLHEISSVITRAGCGSKVLFCGDTDQCDIIKSDSKNKSGAEQLLKIVQYMQEFAIVEFTDTDIVRGGLVKSFLLAKKKALT